MIEVLRLHHVGIAVADLDDSCHYYCSCGYVIDTRMHLEGSDPAVGNGLESTTLDLAFLTCGATTLEILQFDPPGRALAESDPCFGTVPIFGQPPAPHDPDGHRVVTTERPDPVSFTVNTCVPEETAALLELLRFERRGDAFVGHDAIIDLRTVAGAGSSGCQANSPGRTHVCFEVADMERASSEIIASGRSLVSSPRVSGELEWVFVRHDGGPGIELLAVRKEST